MKNKIQLKQHVTTTFRTSTKNITYTKGLFWSTLPCLKYINSSSNLNFEALYNARIVDKH